MKKSLVYAAEARCMCGAGLAYDPAGQSGKPIQGYWDCSAILLGEAVPAGQPGSVDHNDRLPFAFYKIKSENQPSANGATTRPQKRPGDRPNFWERHARRAVLVSLWLYTFAAIPALAWAALSTWQSLRLLGCMP